MDIWALAIKCYFAADSAALAVRGMFMRPRDLFGVGVRLLAVWIWTSAAYYGFLAFMKSVGTAPTNNYPIHGDISLMVFNVVLGAFLMKGARSLIWLAYGDRPKNDQDAENAPETST